MALEAEQVNNGTTQHFTLTKENRMNTNNNKTTDILNVMHNNHRILIDRHDEIDMDGNVAVRRLLCSVITPAHKALIFNVSPFTKITDMHAMVKVWIDCGCPLDTDSIGISRKWDKIHIQALADGIA